MRQRARRFIVVTALAVLALALLVANSLVFFTRVDLTENRIHTISDATREALARLENEVAITYYLSSRLSDRYPQPREVIDLLREYEASSRGRVSLRIVDPQSLPDPTEVESLGIVPQQLEVSGDGEQTFAIVYSGIVIEYLNGRDSLPFVFGTQTLEYDLTSTVLDLVREEPRDLVFVLGNRDESLERSYRAVATELSRSYRVRELPPGDPIADAVDTLVVTDAQRLNSDELARIVDYLDRGGAVLLALESVEVDVTQGLSAEYAGDGPVFRYLASRGIVVEDRLLLDESYNQIRVEEASAEFTVTRSYPYPHWVATLEQFTSPDHPVTARFSGLDLYWPAAIRQTEGGDGSDGPRIIVASTPRAWLMDEPYVVSPGQDRELARGAEATIGQYGLVAVDAGQEDGSSRLAVVADADFLRDVFIGATGSGFNVEFAASLAQWLCADEALLGIRTRASRDVSLNAIADPARERAAVFVARAVNIVVVPGLVAIFGFVRLARRRRRSRAATAGAPR